MEPVSPKDVVANHNRLSDLFGEWPSFHDAEITNISMWRGDVRPDEEKYTFPIVTVGAIVQEITRDPTDQTKLHLVPRADVELRFRDVYEIKIDDFNHSNMISALSFSLLPRGNYTNGEPLPPYIVVEFARGFGLAMSFKCFGAEVVSASKR